MKLKSNGTRLNFHYLVEKILEHKDMLRFYSQLQRGGASWSTSHAKRRLPENLNLEALGYCPVFVPSKKQQYTQ